VGLLDDIENAVEGALNDLEDVVSAIEDAVKDGLQVAGTVLSPIGSAISYVVNGVVYDLYDLIGIHMRSLTWIERDIVQGVFWDSVPPDKILITSIPGKDGRPFTIPGSMVIALAPLVPVLGEVVALSGLLLHLQDKFLINVGSMYSNASLYPSVYDTNKSEKAGSMVIHESTHVWQGIHSAFSWWYVFNSLYNQITCGDAAYDVDEKNLKTFSTYNVEQQAHLIEDWYSRGSLTTDVCYPYVRDNIRPGKPTAMTGLTTVASQGAVNRVGATAMTQAGGPAKTGPANVAGRVGANVMGRPGIGGVG
jgi:hypothetical protein